MNKQVDSKLARRMLEPLNGSSFASIKRKFEGKKVGIGISTPEGLKCVDGKLRLLTYPSQIFVSNIPNKFFEDLFEGKEGSGKFGLSLNRRYFLSGSDYRTNTLRASFTDLDHAIKSINIDGDVVFENPFISVPYIPFKSVRDESEFRLSMGFPLVDRP